MPVTIHTVDPREEADLVSSLYATVGNPAGWHDLLSRLTRASLLEKATLSVHDAALPDDQIDAQIGLDEHIQAYAQHYAALNPWLTRPELRPVGTIVTTDEMLPRSELVRTEYYADFCLKAGMDVGIGLTIGSEGTRSVVISILGMSSALQRDRVARRRLELLAPHLVRVAQLDHQLAAARARAGAAGLVMDRLDIPLLLLDRAGLVMDMNAPAEHLLRTADGLVLRHGRLGAVTPADDNALQALALLAVASLDEGTAPGGTLRISRRSGRWPYEVLVAPSRPDWPSASGRVPRAMVVVRDPDRPSGHSHEPFQALYGLTKAEAKVFAGLVAGWSVQRMGERNKVSVETVRAQVKSLFRKTGTNTQQELIRLGLNGVALLGPRKGPG